MLKGGYQIIDFLNVKIDDENGATISGIADEIESARTFGKPILITGINDDGKAITPFFASYITYDSTADKFTITIGVTADADDGVSVKVLTADSDDKVEIKTTTYVVSE